MSVLEWWDDRHRARVLRTWAGKSNPCAHPEKIRTVCQTPHRVLELGANWGGNLQLFLAAGAECVGIDPNPSVLHHDWPRYTGIVGDDRTLRTLEGQFDLAFTISVLDHLPTARLVARAIQELQRLASTVVILEPYIAGVTGNVSGKRWRR
jgi:2-polyprenyl-3-methyl-5-hydroxy-6-metoxy-1,4-benzoquinol methylase